jgi:hypothetical protein
MKKATITGRNGDELTITAPEGKEMVFDPGILQHGILVLGEHGPSGIKIAAFKDWTEARFVEDDSGYTFVNDNTF